MTSYIETVTDAMKKGSYQDAMLTLMMQWKKMNKRRKKMKSFEK